MIVEILWSVVAFLGMLRAITLLREAILDKRALASLEALNGRRILARWQIEHASVGVAIYLFLLLPGLAALGYRLEVLGLNPRLNLAAIFLVAALLALVARQERDAHYRRRSTINRKQR